MSEKKQTAVNESAKQKAVEMVEKYKDTLIPLESDGYHAKQCALIAVDAIWRELESERVFEKYDFWQHVRSEIEKL